MPLSVLSLPAIGFGSLIIIIGLVLFAIMKLSKIRRLQSEIFKLRKSLDEMDEQAKLIVRTDIELNKTQEELDKKVDGLYALQKISRDIGTTLQEDLIFKLITNEHLEELGFEKACAFLWREHAFVPVLSVGYEHSEMEAIIAHLGTHRQYFSETIESGATISSNALRQDHELLKNITKVFCAKLFVMAPLRPKEGNRGFFFIGTERTDTLITEGDEEIITVLANQLAQALDNARLFEKTWRAQQSLERKVEERTRELSAALKEVQAISRRKTEFISAVSHELRTPLTSIKGYASILLAGKLGEIPESVKERLEKINRHSDELVNFINDLLDIARIESGRMLMKQEPHALREIVAKVVDMLDVQLKDRQLSVPVAIDDNANQVFVDALQIERVFINLIGNAARFTPVQGTISVSAKRHEGSVLVEVCDTGCGIPERDLENIFEEFYRVDNTINQETKGTGLGLSLVKHIIEAHRGKIWATSALRQGSTFSFTLPLQGV